MRDADCIAFLQEHLPGLRMRWAGFRKVRRQVCRRIARRMSELGLSQVEEYRQRLVDNPDEWDVLRRLCRVTISRFFRDRGVFASLGTDVLPSIARSAQETADANIRVWSAGCASGEEAYSLQIAWMLEIAPSAPPLRIIATDIDEGLLERARRGVFRESSLREMPEGLRTRAFRTISGGYEILNMFRKDILFVAQDITRQMPDELFHIILCRNLVFTYCDEPLQRVVLEGMIDRLEPGGYLVIGSHERLPADAPKAIALHSQPCILKKRACGT